VRDRKDTGSTNPDESEQAGSSGRDRGQPARCGGERWRRGSRQGCRRQPSRLRWKPRRRTV
jgi:hypothetical protein